jgi:hypothetical protein
MRRRPLNISAALAIAIERQVEGIIANAKTQCALQGRGASRRGLPDFAMSDPAAGAPPARVEDIEADRRREFSETLRSWSAPGSENPVGKSTSRQRLDIWTWLRSFFTLSRSAPDRVV